MAALMAATGLPARSTQVRCKRSLTTCRATNSTDCVPSQTNHHVVQNAVTAHHNRVTALKCTSTRLLNNSISIRLRSGVVIWWHRTQLQPTIFASAAWVLENV